MAKNIRRMLAMVLVMCMFVSALPMQALAAEGDGVTETTTTNDGVTETTTTNDGVTETTTTNDGVTETTTTSTTTVETNSGNVTITVESNTVSEGVKESTGEKVYGTETSTTTTVMNPVTEQVVSSSQESNSLTEVVKTGSDGSTTVTETEINKSSNNQANGDTYSYENTFEFTTQTDSEGNVIREHWTKDGKEEEKKHEAPNLEGENINVDVSLSKGDTNTVEGDAVGTEREDPKGGSAEVVEQGKVSVETTDVNFEQNLTGTKIDPVTGEEIPFEMEYVHTDASPNASNDLFYYKGCYYPVPETEEEWNELLSKVEDGYQYILMDYSNSSQFFAGWLMKDSEKGYTTVVFEGPDGTPYYGHTSNEYPGLIFDGVYLDGEKVSDEEVRGRWSDVTHFTMIDANTREVITTYCADQMTNSSYGASYNMYNLEDADYYEEDQAAHIRTIAKNGYWGTSEGAGSLAAVQQMMREATDSDGNRIFTDEEADSLTDGMALTATQYAIWHNSNVMLNYEFVNATWVPKDPETNYNKDGFYARTDLTPIPEGREDDVAVIMKLYDYLINMKPETIEDDEKTTANTIINEQNFLKDMNLTVIEKAENHANNEDADSTNDAYKTELTFALVVTPDPVNDDLIVSVVGSNGTTTTVRIAGTPTENEEYDYLTPDANGNYTIKNLVVTEGNQTFTITLDGVQNLENGVYLYKSSVNTKSQTMVGTANGESEVNVSMSLSFNVNIDDEVVVYERVWQDEGDPSYTYEEPPTPMTFVPEDGVAPQVFRLNNDNGLEEIPEEPVPLAAPVITGDNSGLWVAVVLLALCGIVAINVFGKKRQHEAF